MVSEPTTDRPLDVIRRLLSRGDAYEALHFLNGLTPHRFTGMYRFDAPTARNLYIVDKQQPELDRLPDVPMTATYCAFTRPGEGALVVKDAMTDARFTEHPARREVRSYCGVPMLDGDGQMFGTICHFDYEVVPISDANVELLEAVGPLLTSGRPVR